MAESSTAAETPEPTPTDGTPEELETTTMANDAQSEPTVAEQEEVAPAKESSLSDGEMPTEKLPRIVTASSPEEETTTIEESSTPEEKTLEEPALEEEPTVIVPSSPEERALGEPALEETPTLLEPSTPEEKTLEEPALEKTPTLIVPSPQEELSPAVEALAAQKTVSLPEPAVAKEELPEALRVPSQSLGGLYRILLGLASLVSGIASITVNQLLLPTQIATLDPAHQLTSLLLVASAGLLAAFIVAPVAGALSDRTTGRFGRRRPWMLIGLIGGVAALLVMSFSTSVLMLLAGEVLLQICFSFVYTMLSAIIPDQVSLRQRAMVSAAVGIAPVVGSVVGLLVVNLLAQGTQQGYFWLAAISFVVVVLFLLVFREKPLPRGAMPRFHFASFWHNPKRYPNFTLTWFSRSFIFLGYALFVLYLFSYLLNVLHLAAADATLRVLTFQVISTGTLLIFAFLGAWLADRLQQLKLFVTLGAVIMAGSVFLIAFMPLWQYILLASVLFGIGTGLYLAVGLALTIRVLPQARDHGKDLAIMNIPLYLALIIAPLLAGAVLNLANDYTVLFSLAAVAALLAGVLIVPVNFQRS